MSVVIYVYGIICILWSLSSFFMVSA